MRPYKTKKIDLSSEYPCPCRRKGNLKPIVLTEALGCDRCQQIFIVKENNQVIEQLASIYHKKSWRWTGERWKNAYSLWTSSSLSAMLALMTFSAVSAAIILPPLLRWLTAQSIILWAIVLSILIILLVLMLLIIYRH